MTYSYFPGCTLRTQGRELDQYGRRAAEALGFSLQEPADWQCCGAVYPMARDEIAPRLSSVRALMAARERGQELVTLCSACYHVVKRVNNDLRTDETIRDRVNRYLAPDTPYCGETNVLHYLEVLRDRVGFDTLREKVVNPLTGRRIGAYYGCLLLRPGKVMEFDDPENPKILEDFITAIGGTPVIYAQRNECCGAYAAFEDETIPQKRSASILANAEDMGADFLVTSCPLCRYNLIKNKGSSKLDVIYFTELLAEALGVKDAVAKEAVNA